MKPIILLLTLVLIITCKSTPGDGIVGCTGNQSPFELIDH